MNSFVFHDFQYSVATFSIRNKTEEESIFLEAKCLQGGQIVANICQEVPSLNVM